MRQLGNNEHPITVEFIQKERALLFCLNQPKEWLRVHAWQLTPTFSELIKAPAEILYDETEPDSLEDIKLLLFWKKRNKNNVSQLHQIPLIVASLALDISVVMFQGPLVPKLTGMLRDGLMQKTS